MNDANLTADAPSIVERTQGRGGDQAIGALLLAAGKLKPADLDRVLKLQKEKGIRFGEAAIKLKLVVETDIQRALALQFHYPYAADSKLLDPRLIVAASPFDPMTEIFRTLRAQLMLHWFGQERKVLAVGATTDKEDADLLVANLAVLFAQLGKKTLLIDADLRNSKLGVLFKIGQGSGLSDLLGGRVQNMSVHGIQPFTTLSYLSAGTPPPNPSELLLKAPMDFLLEEAARNYDIILINTPSAERASDYQVIAARAGGILIATKKNVTRLSALTDYKHKISATGAMLVGAAMLT